MRELIAGILEYSRLVSAEDQRSEAIESNEILGVVIQNLQATIEQTRATITHEELPPRSWQPAAVDSVISKFDRQCDQISSE